VSSRRTSKERSSDRAKGHNQEDCDGEIEEYRHLGNEKPEQDRQHVRYDDVPELPAGFVQVRIIGAWCSQVLSSGVDTERSAQQSNQQQRQSIDDYGQTLPVRGPVQRLDHEPCRKRLERNCEQEKKIQPEEDGVGSLKAIGETLMSDSGGTDRQETDEIGEITARHGRTWDSTEAPLLSLRVSDLEGES